MTNLNASDELSCGNPNKESQSIEQRLEFLEREVSRLSKIVARSSKPPLTEKKEEKRWYRSTLTKKKGEKRRYTSNRTEDRIRRLKLAAKEYWMSRINGNPISKRQAARQNEFVKYGDPTKGEQNILSKPIANPYMKPIEEKYGGILPYFSTFRPY